MYVTSGARNSVRFLLGCDINHVRLALFAEVREFAHVTSGYKSVCVDKSI